MSSPTGNASRSKTIAPRLFALFVLLLSFLTLIVQNLATHNDLAVIGAPRGASVTIGYGWPMIALAGEVNTDEYMQSTFPLQFWRSTSEVRVVPLGALVNLVVLFILCFSAYVFSFRFYSLFRSAMRLQYVFGVFVYVAFVVVVRINSWRPLVRLEPDYPLLDAIDMVLTYTENYVWLLVLIACLSTSRLIAKLCNVGFFGHRPA